MLAHTGADHDGRGTCLPLPSAAPAFFVFHGDYLGMHRSSAYSAPFPTYGLIQTSTDVDRIGTGDVATTPVAGFAVGIVAIAITLRGKGSAVGTEHPRPVRDIDDRYIPHTAKRGRDAVGIRFAGVRRRENEVSKPPPSSARPVAETRLGPR